MSRRKIRVISFFCGILLAVGGFAILCGLQRRDFRRLQEKVQFRAITDVSTHLVRMAESLALSVEGDLPLPHLIAVRHHADLASAALGEVHFFGEGGEALRRFVMCTAEFAAEMADDLARGSRRVPDYALLVRLRDFAVPLVEEILPAALFADSPAFDEAVVGAYLSGLGRLYYDGVSSDVQPQSGYLSLANRAPIGEASALHLAEQIAGETARLRTISVRGEPDRYCFGCGNLTLTLTAVDGNLLSLFHDRLGGEGDLGEERARVAAKEALLRYAPEEMAETEVFFEGGTYYFTFAPMRQDLLCLSERILIGIDAATARLNLWDADRYYRYSGTERWLPDSLIPPERAAAYLGVDTLPCLCTALRSDGREILCYCVKNDGNTVYLNAVTGQIEQVS